MCKEATWWYPKLLLRSQKQAHLVVGLPTAVHRLQLLGMLLLDLALTWVQWADGEDAVYPVGIPQHLQRK